MADKRVVSDIVTKFLLNTCRLRPQITRHAVQAAWHCAAVATLHPPDDEEADVIPLTTGSVAEFYIEPMLPYVGDVDVMHHRSTELAIPRGHRPPTQLPAEFSNYVKVFEIVDSHLPGYVYLELRYLLTECIDDDKYNYAEYGRGKYTINYTYLGDVRHSHGPAVLTDYSEVLMPTLLISVDTVRCLRCLSWPSQAADWPTRHRDYEWPDSATADHVVSNGCDVVGVAHRLCRQDEWMSKRQWRLSFSRAEIALLNSWMPVQQIVYHMLRYFMKTKRMMDSADNSEQVVVSNYHIKTLMLWASELKPRSWWTASLNLVRICVELLHTLSLWLTDTCCPHYFINSCNLVDSSMSLGTATSELMSIDESYLSTWFVYEYIGKCTELCPALVRRSFDNASTVIELQNAVSAIVEFRLDTSLQHLWRALEFAEINIQGFFTISDLTVRSCVRWMNELSKCHLGPHLSEYFSAVALLHVASKISINDFNENLLNVSATILGQLNETQRRCKQHCSVTSLSKAAKLMKLIANKLVSTVQLEVELSKAYLHTALRCKDSDSDSIYCLTNVYLAVLYYTTGQYQTASDHCTLVTRSQGHSQCSSHVVQGELLPKIDKDVDNMLGLTVLYQYILLTALNQQRQKQYVSVFTTEIFAYYLHCRLLLLTQCRFGTQMPIPDMGQWSAKYIYEINQLFIGDVLVFKSLNDALQQTVSDNPQLNKLKCGRLSVSETELNASEVVELMQQSAVEHMTTYRQLEARDFGSVVTIVTTDFEALYAYKHGDYQRCLELSTQNVRTLLYAVDMPGVATFSQFIQLLDDDIVSLTALIQIANPTCTCRLGDISISQVTLSLYLMTQCQLKLRHSVTSLAQTLDYIKVAHRRHPAEFRLDRLTLKLAECKGTTQLRRLLSN